MIATVFLLALVIACGAEPKVVVDASGLLSSQERSNISQQHGLLLRDHDVDYRVEIASGVEDLSRHAALRFAQLGVGSRSGEGLGLLLVLDPERDRVRLEVGQRLEGHVSDAFVAYVEERQMVPFFRAGRVGDGILAATELIVSQLQRSQPFDVIGSRDSAGGGAERRAALGAGSDGIFRDGPDVDARNTPEETVTQYLAAMNERNGNAALDLYTAGTREMQKDWVVTAGQMDAIARTYRRCSPETARVDADDRHAVIRYSVEDRTCAPWFLVREGERWRLDLLESQQRIRFGAGNAWRFAERPDARYAFAFADWRLDRNGFPQAD